MKHLVTDTFPPFSSFLPFHSYSHPLASVKSHLSRTGGWCHQDCPTFVPIRLHQGCLWTCQALWHTAKVLKKGRGSSHGTLNKDTWKFGLWLKFQDMVLGYATDFHKTWANPWISHAEPFWEIQLLALPDASKNCFSTAQGFPQIYSQSLERLCRHFCKGDRNKGAILQPHLRRIL